MRAQRETVSKERGVGRTLDETDGTVNARLARPKRWSAWALAFLRRHWLFLLLLTAGVALRAVTFLAYRPVIFGPDSFWYLAQSESLKPSVLKPAGYAGFLRTLPAESALAVIPFVQHLLGVAVALVIYVLLLRLGLRGWLAALATAPVLLDAYQLNIEQQILSEALFDLFLVVAFALLLWRPPPGLALAGAAGLLLAAATLTRGIGILVIVPALLTVLFLRAGAWRAISLLAAFALPLVAYAFWFHSWHGQYALTTYEGRFLYGRVASFMDCNRFEVPPHERVLCPQRRGGEPLTVPELLWGELSPVRDVRPPPGQTRPDVAGEFSRRVIRHQPLDYLRAVGTDFLLAFAPTRTARAGEFGVEHWQFQRTYPVFLPPRRASPLGSVCTPGPKSPSTETACEQKRRRTTAVIRAHGGERGYAQPQLASFLHVYQRFGYTPGPLLAAFLLGALAAAVGLGRAGRSGLRSAAFLLASSSLVLLVAGVAFTVFSWRYELPLLVLLPPAFAIGVTALTREPNADTGPPGDSGRSAAKTGAGRRFGVGWTRLRDRWRRP